MCSKTNFKPPANSILLSLRLVMTQVMEVTSDAVYCVMRRGARLSSVHLRLMLSLSFTPTLTCACACPTPTPFFVGVQNLIVRDGHYSLAPVAIDPALVVSDLPTIVSLDLDTQGKPCGITVIASPLPAYVDFLKRELIRWQFAVPHLQKNGVPEAECARIRILIYSRRSGRHIIWELPQFSRK
jgi:hypothetical protein